MNYKNTKNWVLRARTIDEPFVIDALKSAGYSARQGTEYDDWNHTDIFVDFGNGEVSVDVKRNYSKQKDSPNMTFTHISDTGQKFPFKDTGYFAFINDANGQIYFVSHQIIKNFVETYKSFKSKFSNKSEYIIIPKYILKKYAYKILSGDLTKLN